MMRRIKGKIGERLATQGITPDSVSEKVLLPGLEATKIERIPHKGKIQRFEDVDHEQRGKYADRIFKLVGLIGSGHDNGEPPPVGVRPGHISLTLVLPPGEDVKALLALNTGSATNREQPVLELDEDARRQDPSQPYK